jgi:hypothetical protein
LDRDGISAQQARSIDEDLSRLPPFSTFTEAIDFERLALLDLLIRFWMVPGELQYFNNTLLDGGVRVAALQYATVDWNAALIEVNRWYDRVTGANGAQTPMARVRAFDALQSDLSKASEEMDRFSSIVASWLSRQTRGHFAGRYVAAANLGPSMWSVRLKDLQDRANTRVQLVRLAAALACHRAESGRYPDQLEMLVSGVPSESLFDAYSGSKLIYKKEGAGYLLYSTSVNGIDDGGSSAQGQVFQGRSTEDLDAAEAEALRSGISAGADDISIRVPRPKFEMPK